MIFLFGSPHNYSCANHHILWLKPPFDPNFHDIEIIRCRKDQVMLFWSQSWKQVCACPQGIAQDDPVGCFMWGFPGNCLFNGKINIIRDPNLADSKGDEFSTGEKSIAICAWYYFDVSLSNLSIKEKIWWWIITFFGVPHRRDSCWPRRGLCPWAFPWWAALALQTNQRTHRRLKRWALRCRCADGPVLDLQS